MAHYTSFFGASMKVTSGLNFTLNSGKRNADFNGLAFYLMNKPNHKAAQHRHVRQSNGKRQRETQSDRSRPALHLSSQRKDLHLHIHRIMSSALAVLDVVEWIIILTRSDIAGVTQGVQGDNVFFNTGLLHGASPIMVVCHRQKRHDVRLTFGN